MFFFAITYLFLEVSHLGNDAGHCYEDATWKRGPPAVQWECRPFQPRHKSPTHIPQLQEKQTYWKTIQQPRSSRASWKHKSKKVPSSLLRCGSNSSTFILIWVHDLCEPSNRKPKSLESSKLRRMKCFCLPPVEHWHWGLKGQGLKWERWSRGTWALLPRQQDTIMRKSMVAQDLAKVSQVPSLTPAVVADILYEGRSRPLHLCLTRWRRLGRICKMAKDEALVIF